LSTRSPVALRLLGWVALAAAAALGAWWIGSGGPSRWLTAMQVLDELRRPGTDSWLERATRAPTVTRLRLGGPLVGFEADLYRPAAGGSPVPMLLVPGAVELGKADPRVPPFARLLARAGFTVVVPDLPSMRTLRVQRDHVRELAAAHAALCARADLAPRGRAGIFGVSYAGGVAMLAALDPARAPHVPWVATVGAFADLDTAVRFLATGLVHERGRVRRVKVDPYGHLVFVRTYQEFVPDADRRTLEAIVQRRMGDPGAPIADLVAALGPEGRLVVDLLEGGDAARVPELMARLPAELRRLMADLSPGRRELASLRARLYLAHAVDDGVFPVTESERLARRARGRVPVALVRLAALQHVDPEPWRRDPWGFLTRDLPEAVRLAAWWAALLAERDR
jgi:acetyl esterase/lipase